MNLNNEYNNNFNPPLRVVINNYSFSLKDKLKNNNYTYRCMDRKNCNSSIHINESELSNYLSNNHYNINITKTINPHKFECEFNK